VQRTWPLRSGHFLLGKRLARWTADVHPASDTADAVVVTAVAAVAVAAGAGVGTGAGAAAAGTPSATFQKWPGGIEEGAGSVSAPRLACSEAGAAAAAIPVAVVPSMFFRFRWRRRVMLLL